MTPELTILQGDCREKLRELPDCSVHCCVTSPPYFGLRDYGTAQWEGGSMECDHLGSPMRTNNKPSNHDATFHGGTTRAQEFYRDTCGRCGARRVDSQIGLEQTPDAYVAELVEVFREVRRVLRDDGSLWLNLGDSYANDGKWGGHTGGKHVKALHGSPIGRNKRYTGLKPKDLIGIPWAVAFALRDPYYAGRIKDERDRVWLAAMLDAEGCICGTEYETAGRIKTNLYISITNSSIPIIDKCERLFAQDVKHIYEKGDVKNKIVYRWDVERLDQKAMFLREIYPYLVAKRKQAIIGYTFLEMQRGLPSKKKGYLPEQHEQRSWMMGALSKLNQGQDIDLPDWVIEPPSLFEPGFYLRQDIIYSKPNPMPESVTDRCTKAHEYIFLLSKSPTYYYDQEAIKEIGKDPLDDLRRISKATLSGKSTPDEERNGIRRKVKVPGGWDTAEGAHGSFHRNGRAQEIEYTEDVATTRNKRSVWTVPTFGFPEAHFATYPPALIKPCILAGTSSAGCCAKCGAPLERIVEREKMQVRPGPTREARSEDGRLRTQVNGTMIKPPRQHTTGWQRTCKCEDAGGTVPCVILDPFAGSGTTGAVALGLGRSAILIELNPDYIKLIEKRCRVNLPLMFEGSA